ncbi:MAG: DUF6787 family protein [Tunicatimonas sp.]
MLEKLKQRWGVTSAGQVILILIVFACTGFSVLFIKQPLYDLAGITAQTSPWIRVPFYLLTVLPAYQVLLLAYGFLFGQFRFFWNFEKRMFSRIKRLFSPRRSG